MDHHLNDTPGPTTAPVRPGRHWLRLGAPAVVLAALAICAAACGGGSASPGVASIGATTTIATAANSAASTSAKGPSGQIGADALKFAACMRAHGVPQFPSPIVTSHNVTIKISPGPGLNPNSPQYRSALNGCRSLLPAGPGKNQTITAADQVDYLKAAQCMRAHGIVGFPDPSFSNGGVEFNLPSGMDANAMPFRRARVICEKLIPSGLPYSN